jgi:hypothetical protein
MPARARATDRRADNTATRATTPAAVDLHRLDPTLPAVVAGLILVGAALVPLGTVELGPPAAPAASSGSDPGARPFPPIRSRTIVSTGPGMRILVVAVAVAWRGHVPEAQSARLVLRRTTRSPAAEHLRDARSVTIPVALMSRAGGDLSLRVAIDVSILSGGDYAVVLRLPHPTGGAWAPGSQDSDERLLGTYSAPALPAGALCCPAW